jgi:hypothetical protein
MGAAMKWGTRSRARVDGIACPCPTSRDGSENMARQFPVHDVRYAYGTTQVARGA